MLNDAKRTNPAMLVPLIVTLTIIVGVTHVLAGDGEHLQTGRVRGDGKDLAEHERSGEVFRREQRGVPKAPPSPTDPVGASKETKTPVAADEFVELVIPLSKGRFYSLRDVIRESNAKLNTTYDLKIVPDRRHELTDRQKDSLRILATVTGWFRVRFSENQMVLELPNRESEAVRRRNRQWLSRWLRVRPNEWSENQGLKIPQDFRPEARTVLLIHGVESNTDAMSGLSRACRNWGVQVLTFDYPNDGPLATSGERLNEDLRKLSAKHRQFRVVIVAHSMGGLVARYALEKPDANLNCVTDLFTLGTPHQGSRLAGAQPWLELLCEVLPGIATGDALSSVRDGLGEAADDVRPGSQFLVKLNRWKRAPGVRYHTAAGRKGFVTKQQYRTVVKQLDQLLVKREVSVLARAQILGFVKQGADELQAETGDGVVTVASARLKGATTTKTFDLNHLELISTPEERPEESKVFRWVVNTLDWQQVEARNP